MATTVHYIDNVECEWAKLYEHNHDSYGGKDFCSIDLLLNKEQVEKLKATGSKARPKFEESGKYRVKLRRNLENRIADFGGVPEVVDAEGNNFTKLIGNGSIVSVKFSVYDTKMGPGTRLEKVRVDELKEYVKPEPTVSGTSDDSVGLPF